LKEKKDESNIITESSVDEEDEQLTPLNPQRVFSLQVGANSKQGGEQEMATWVESYRKWRQWNRFYKHREGGA